MHKFITVIFILSVLSSCTKKETGSIRVERIPIAIKKGENLRLSKFVDSIQIIPLETTSDCLIGEVNRVVYKNNHYYLRATRGMQSGRLLVFDSNGTFVLKIHNEGGGPGGWINMKDFVLNQNSEIKIMSLGKVITYDTEGHFLRENKIDIPLTKEILPYIKDKYLVYRRGAPSRDYNLLSIMNEKDQFEENFFQIEKDDVCKSETTFNFNSLFSFNDSIYFSYPYCDTIYQISNSLKEKPIYYIDYGSKRIPGKIFVESDGVKEIDKKLERYSDFGKAAAFGITEDLVYIGSRDKVYNGYFSLYSKKTKQVLTGQRIVDDMYFVGNTISMKSKHLPYNFDGNDILWQVDPSYILDGFHGYKAKVSQEEWEKFCQKYPRLVKICSQMKEDDNPVILRVTLKDI
ncbi:hypothetical protein M2480_001463 [Parabacteroides sp. PFB2-12]|uniref:6-bladed beta-propeller n=1 Tax=unclassified Parabacteroides TaxID=2649774 RepID=UPI00247611C1|nr:MULTISPECIES: 6-bladed beta-propeller [unclassified Parabacteroides]MDH6342882.1 hypothetical protein [Parabacteroides sp. PM6-13]MDH6390488.1 hypothetical protein [Parabacteroides sp. PFB2-12]